jgi:oligopeptide/dipeptide ABC transporter ATP-binding protein
VSAREPLLVVDGVRIAVRRTGAPPLVVVDTADLIVAPGEIVGIVGESGSGKTMLCRSLIGTLGRRDAFVTDGRIRLAGRELVGAPESTWKDIRGKQIGYVPQSALAGPNPVLTVDAQLREAFARDRGRSSADARLEARRLLELVHMSAPDVVLRQYPHQLSGGMRQRVMIASALARRPMLLVADEPTTGLDVTVQAGIMRLLQEIRRDLDMAVILVSHDLALIEDVCDRVVVMHAGATVEAGATEQVLTRPRHPYTAALQRSRIDVAEPGETLRVISGEAPSVGSWPPGCRFAPRCPIARDDCVVGAHPPLEPFAGQLTACVHADLVDAAR